ncbi:MAG: hypothetical protein V4618_12745 [Pseudomonadota bacterium]
MSKQQHDIRTEGRQLVEAARKATLRHATSWKELVPNAVDINRSAESAEESAYSEMAMAKQALRDHILGVYGISMRELTSLMAP